MAQCVDFTSEGFLRKSGTENCEAYVLVSSSEYADMVAHQSVSASEASVAIGFGFAVVFGIGFLPTYGVAVAKRVIRLL